MEQTVEQESGSERAHPEVTYGVVDTVSEEYIAGELDDEELEAELESVVEAHDVEGMPPLVDEQRSTPRKLAGFLGSLGVLSGAFGIAFVSLLALLLLVPLIPVFVYAVFAPVAGGLAAVAGIGLAVAYLFQLRDSVGTRVFTG